MIEILVTIDPVEANVWPLIEGAILAGLVGFALLVFALLMGVLATILRREPGIKVAAWIIAGAGILLITVGLVRDNQQYAAVQNLWHEQTARNQEIALAKLGYTDVHVTPFLGADDHLFYDFSATKNNRPYSGIMTPTPQERVYDAVMFPADQPLPKPTTTTPLSGGG